jgi:hypothetical protein
VPRMPESDDAASSAGGAPSAGAGGEVGTGGRPGYEGQSAGTQVPGPQVAAWAGEVGDRVIDGVGWLKARTTLPVTKVLRAVVYGLVVLISLVTALVLVVLGLVRIWDAYVPVHPLGRRVWLGYVVLGGVLFLAGGLVLARRTIDRGRS